MDLSVVVPEEKRSKTVQELYTSEVLYVSNLKDMIEVCTKQNNVFILFYLFFSRDLLFLYVRRM